MPNEYRSPPVNEVVFGAKFDELPKWKIPHTGAFWDQVRYEFPNCEHAQPLVVSEVIDEESGFPIPRVWLVNGTEDKLIQLQPGWILFNWRRRQADADYPRYRVLSEEAFAHLRSFFEFCRSMQLGEPRMQHFELSYINHIYSPEGWSFPSDIGKVFPHMTDSARLRANPVQLGWNGTFPINARSRLQMQLQTVRKVADERLFLLFELTARGLPDGESLVGMQDWFSEAHTWIVRSFDELTSAIAQEVLWHKHV